MAAGQAPRGALEDFVAQVRDYAIIALDPQGVIQTWNRGAEELKGYSAQEAVGRSFAMFYPDADRRAGLPMELLSRAREDGRVEHSGWRVRKDGTRFWGNVVITALNDESGRLAGYAKVTRDLTEQHALEERLRSSEERLRLLVGQVVDYAIIALDPQGVIETWNRGAERLKGYAAEEAVGRSFAMFYPEEQRRDGLPMRLLVRAMRDGRVEHTGWRVRKDGSRFWADVVITALQDGDGKVTGYAKVTRDRTDLKRLEEAQDAFYAAFVHDFRTPVTALKGYVEAIRESRDDEERELLVDRVDANADRLLHMVEGLVEFARSRRDHAELNPVELDLGDLVRAAVHDLPPSLHPERVRVGRGHAHAVADPEAMRRVVTNLVVNALKYSDPDTRVDVRVQRAARGSVALVVTDHGRGIAPDDLDLVFQEFQRGRLAQHDGGTGLGLSSVRDLVEQQQGSVHLESEVGRGTTVRVLVPAARPATVIPPQEPRAPHGLVPDQVVPNGVPGAVVQPVAPLAAPTGQSSG